MRAGPSLDGQPQGASFHTYLFEGEFVEVVDAIQFRSVQLYPAAGLCFVDRNSVFGGRGLRGKSIGKGEVLGRPIFCIELLHCHAARWVLHHVILGGKQVCQRLFTRLRTGRFRHRRDVDPAFKSICKLCISAVLRRKFGRALQASLNRRVARVDEKTSPGAKRVGGRSFRLQGQRSIGTLGEQ